MLARLPAQRPGSHNHHSARVKAASAQSAQALRSWQGRVGCHAHRLSPSPTPGVKVTVIATGDGSVPPLPPPLCCAAAAAAAAASCCQRRNHAKYTCGSTSCMLPGGRCAR
jgi:hypothetical protein